MSCLVLHLLLVDIVRVCVADVPVHHPQRQEQKQVPQGQGVAHQVSPDRLLWETPDVLPPLGRSEVLHGQQAVQGEGAPEEPGGGEIQTHFSTDVSKRGKTVFLVQLLTCPSSWPRVPPAGWSRAWPPTTAARRGSAPRPAGRSRTPTPAWTRSGK